MYLQGKIYYTELQDEVHKILYIKSNRQEHIFYDLEDDSTYNIQKDSDRIIHSDMYSVIDHYIAEETKEFIADLSWDIKVALEDYISKLMVIVEYDEKGTVMPYNVLDSIHKIL